MTGSRPAAALDPPEELARRAAGGDEAAFARLVRLHNEEMTRVAYVVTGDRDAAAEAAEAAWIEAWSRLRRRPQTVGIGSWLASLAAARAITLARGEPAVGPGTSAPPAPASTAPSPIPGVVVPVAGTSADAALAGALARLRPEERAELALVHVAGLTPPEVAARWRRPRHRVEVRLVRRVAGLLRCGAAGPGTDPHGHADAVSSTVAALSGSRLCAYVRIPVRPVDADALARRAHAEAALERTRIISVGIAACVGALVALHPYLAALAFGR